MRNANDEAMHHGRDLLADSARYIPSWIHQVRVVLKVGWIMTSVFSCVFMSGTQTMMWL